MTTPAGEGPPRQYDQGYGQQGYAQQGHGQHGYGTDGPGGAGGPGYGYGEPARPAPRNGLGTAALVFGILALITCWIPAVGLILGIVAIVLGVMGRKRVKRMEATNGGVALTGLVLGIVSVVINVILIVAGIVFGFALFNSGVGQSAQQCVAQAQQSPDPAAAQQACQQQIQEQIQRQFGG